MRIERRGRYCIVYEPVKAVYRSEVCDALERLIVRGGHAHYLLLGPPGTGKSTFIEIVNIESDRYIVYFEPERILSKYVGETEQRFYDLITDAENNAPSIILVDEADMIIMRRTASEDPTINIASSIVRMLLRKLQQWSKDKTVSFIASTNKPLSEIDPGLARGQRFTPLYFPIPDVEMVRLLFELYGREPPSEEEIISILMRAPSFANIVEYIETGRLSEFQIAPFVKLLSMPRIECSIERSKVVVISEEHPVAAVVAALYSSISTGKPVMLLLDPAYHEDAVWLSKTTGFPIAIPYSPVIEQKIYSIIYRADTVYLLGKEWRIAARSVDARSIEYYCGRVVRKKLGCKSTERLESCIARLAFP